MSHKPVWMETWAYDDRDGIDIASGHWATDWTGQRAKLAAAAPQLVRALLAVEWGGMEPGMDGGGEACCPDCGNFHFVAGGPTHRDWCSVDAALTAAGFPDQASRDEARKLMGSR